MIRGILRFICFLMIFFLICFCILLGVVIRLNSPPEEAPRQTAEDQNLRLEEDGSLFLEVRNGESADSVGRRLEQAGVIRSRHFWQILSRVKKEYIKTGAYRMELPASQMAIHSRLVSGEQILVKITIPEGVTLKKTARLLEEAGICGAEDFLAAASSKEIRDAYHVPGPTMEGYLYPDTYLFPLSFPARQVVIVMADTFFERLGQIIPETLSMNLEELNKKVIIASIVEREYQADDEAGLMAGVFYNRLDIGMALQSCATVEYIITEIQERPHPEILYNRDLEIRDPYNTYLRPGLPPGPISAPGRTALSAAFWPEPSDFLYFRLTGIESGRHYFSKTLDEHIRAGRLYTKKL